MSAEETGAFQTVQTPRAPAAGARWLTVFTLLAVLISMISATFSVYSFRVTSSGDSIRVQYEMFLDLTKLPQSDPAIAHLVVMPDKYAIVKEMVAAATADANPRERAALEIKERFIANYIFTLYEYTLYQQTLAANAWVSPEKRQFNQDVLDYFTGRVLRNPRLLWYWTEEGGGLATYYEGSTREHYEANVLNDVSRPLAETPDESGPYSADLVSTAPVSVD